MDKSDKIEKLNNKNYFNWKFKMKLILIKEDLWDTVVNEPPTGRGLAAWNKRDAKAFSTIGLAVENGQLVHIRNSETASEAWRNLAEIHEKNTLTNHISLYKKIALHRMKSGDDMEQHISELDGYFQQLSDLGTVVQELWKVGMLLASLPKEYANLVTALEARDESEITWGLVYSKILDEHQRQTTNNDDVIEERVMKITSTSTNMLCHFCKKNNHEMRDCFGYKRYQQFREFEDFQRQKTDNMNEKVNRVMLDDCENEEDEEICVLSFKTESKVENQILSVQENLDLNQDSRVPVLNTLNDGQSGNYRIKLDKKQDWKKVKRKEENKLL